MFRSLLIRSGGNNLLKKYSSYSVFKASSLVVNLLNLRLMTVSFSDHMLVDFYEDLTLGVLLSVIIDFGKSKFALANGPTRRIDISLLLAVLVILTIQFFDIISPVTALVCSVSTVTLYLKSIELYTGSYLKWFLMEISLSVPLLTALLFNTLFADTFMQLYCVLLVLILVVSVVSYISTGTRIVFFDLYPILFAESVVYQLISYSFFKSDLSELPKFILVVYLT